MRFYPSLSLQAVWELTGDESEMLVQAMSVIEAREAIVALKVSAFPHLKTEGQESIRREFDRAAYPDKYRAPVVMTSDKLAEFISGRK